jgi:ubiquinone/menaquinone biosynthesis C-methylase UbiE
MVFPLVPENFFHKGENFCLMKKVLALMEKVRALIKKVLALIKKVQKLRRMIHFLVLENHFQTESARPHPRKIGANRGNNRMHARLTRPLPALLLALCGLFGGGATGVSAQQTNTPPKHPPYVKRADHDPNGTGIFYMGREMAQVMGHQAADWLDRPEREAEEAPSLLIRALKFKPGQVVADIGAGSGYLTLPIAKLVAPSGKVFAVEIQQEMLDIILSKGKETGIKNVVPILGTPSDPKLPPSSCDLIFMVDVYHEFDHPYEMTAAMVRALKPGGRLVFVEYRGEDPNVPIKEVHKMTEKQVRREMALFPIRYVETLRVLPRQHILIFRK